jgi:hypothetical protein
MFLLNPQSLFNCVQTLSDAPLMPRGTKLTQEEKASILAYHDAKFSARAIATKLNRSVTVVSNFLKAPASYNTRKRPGRKPRLNPRDFRRLVTQASKGLSTAKQMKCDQQVPVGVRRIQQLLSKTDHLRWETRQQMPWMTKRHMIQRLNWARDQLNNDRDWASVVFSDEKKFNLDGPDGIQGYWRDLRKEPQYFKKRQSGGGSVMVWGAFAAAGKTELAFLNGSQDSSKYCSTLENHLLPRGASIGGPLWIFQQDNASIHMSSVTKNWLSDNFVQVLPWPSRSPDLNPIENLWGLIVREVYANGRCYENVSSLRENIAAAWAKIPISLLSSLVKSMNKRCVEVLLKKGGVIDY